MGTTSRGRYSSEGGSNRLCVCFWYSWCCVVDGGEVVPLSKEVLENFSGASLAPLLKSVKCEVRVRRLASQEHTMDLAPDGWRTLRTTASINYYGLSTQRLPHSNSTLHPTTTADTQLLPQCLNASAPNSALPVSIISPAELKRHF